VLITTFLENNDRLSAIVASALRPYSLTTKPAACLSLFLDFSRLSTWYGETLKSDMQMCTRNVVDAWKDKQKDVSGNAALYAYPLPWIPLRLKETHGIFFTQIPEDLVGYLTTYLTHTQAKRREQHKSTATVAGKDAHSDDVLSDQLSILEVNTQSSYVNAFLYLAELYSSALTMEKNFSTIVDDEEIEEYVTWLCSVSNDAKRVREHKHMIPVSSSNTGRNDDFLDENRQFSAEVTKPIELTIQAFSLLQRRALDQLSCVLFLCILRDRQSLFKEETSLFAEWSQFYRELSPLATGKFFDDMVDDCVDFLQERKDYFEVENFQFFVEIVVDKLLIMYLSLLMQARLAGEVIKTVGGQMAWFPLFVEEGLSLANRCLTLLTDNDILSPDRKWRSLSETSSSLAVLELILPSLSVDISDSELHGLISAISECAKRSHIESRLSDGAGNCLKTLCSFKGMKRFYSPLQHRHALRAMISPSAHKPALRRFTFASLSPSHASSSATTPSPTAPTPRRSSLAGFLHKKFFPDTEALSHDDPGPTVVCQSNEQEVTVAVENDNNDEHHDLLAIKLDAVAACLEQYIDEKLQFKELEQDNKVSSAEAQLLISKDAFSRVFSPFRDSHSHERQSLSMQLFFSALPAATKDSLLRQSPINAIRGWWKARAPLSARRPLKSLRFRELHSSPPLPPPVSTVTTVTAAGGSATTRLVYHKSFLFSPNTANASLMDPKLSILLHEVRVENLFPLHWFQAPKPFVVMRVGNYSVRTTSQDSLDGIVSWNDDAACVLKIPEIVTSQSSLVFDLVYEGYMRDSWIASAHFDFNPFDPPPVLQNKELVFTDYASTTKIAEAVQAMKEEGRSLPTITVSLRMLSHL
jgi:hypothetical protein